MTEEKIGNVTTITLSHEEFIKSIKSGKFPMQSGPFLVDGVTNINITNVPVGFKEYYADLGFKITHTNTENND
jgi:hypothetical protein